MLPSRILFFLHVPCCAPFHHTGNFPLWLLARYCTTRLASRAASCYAYRVSYGIWMWMCHGVRWNVGTVQYERSVLTQKIQDQGVQSDTKRVRSCIVWVFISLLLLLWAPRREKYKKLSTLSQLNRVHIYVSLFMYKHRLRRHPAEYPGENKEKGPKNSLLDPRGVETYRGRFKNWTQNLYIDSRAQSTDSFTIAYGKSKDARGIKLATKPTRAWT